MSTPDQFRLDGDTLPPEPPTPVKRKQAALFEMYRDKKPGSPREPTFMDWMAQQ